MAQWKALQKYIIDHKFKGYEKWKDGTDFRCNICMIDIEEGEISISYKRLKMTDRYRDNFSEEFKDLIMSHAETAMIGKIIQDKVKARKVLDKLTIKLLFSKLPQVIKNKLDKHENEIMKKLEITKFVDVSRVTADTLKLSLSSYLTESEINQITSVLLKEIEEYMKVVQEFNLF